MAQNLPLFLPEANWTPPTEFPDLSAAPEICIDLETRDPDLLSRGPGWATGNGEVVGIAVATEAFAGYYPIAHAEGPNMDRDKVLAWLREQVRRDDQPKVFHNGVYDRGWLRRLGVHTHGVTIDTMIAGPLLDENRKGYSLNAMGADYLGVKKDERILYDAARAFGVDPKAGMWKLPAMFVGAYAEQDARLTLQLWQKLKPLIAEQGLEGIFALESELLSCWLEMRWRGVRVNALRAEQLSEKWKKDEGALAKQMKRDVGVAVDVWANESVANAFDRMGIEYPRTALGTPSFRKGWLETHPHPLAQSIVAIRSINKSRSTFIDGLMEFATADGRIHCEWNPLRAGDDDENGGMRGTVSGRISSSKPNLQQIPARGDIGHEIRSLFLPEEGHQWASADFSSQEPRLMAHLAAKLQLRGAAPLVERFRQDPDTDIYSFMAEQAGIERKKAKVVFLGLSYGMGKGKLATQLGCTPDEAAALVAKFNENVPFVAELMEGVQRRVHERGFVKTILGRICRFDTWEPARRQDTWEAPLPRAAAAAKWPGQALKRAWAYKGLNRVIQGGAADQTKKALLDLWKQGIVPMLQVHDELCVSVETREQAEVVRETMVHAVELDVPTKVDLEIGPSWGEAK